MTNAERWNAIWTGVMAGFLLCLAPAAFSQPIIFSGKYEYAVPEPMYDKMIELAPIESWIHFSELTRLIDADSDGASDFVAIALGANGGYGAQIRYRLSHGESGGEPALGAWYWCVITDDGGEKIFEQFNP